MITVSLEINGRVFEQFAEDLSQVPAQFIDTLESTFVPQTQVRFGGLLNTQPGPVKIPFEFETERSRRFYFANFETPYQRTGNTQKWRVEGRRISDSLYEVWLVNDAPKSGYVFGPRQVRGHVNTGWPNVYLTLANERGAVAADALALFGSAFRRTS